MNINKLKLIVSAAKTKYIIIRSVRKELKKSTILKCLDSTEIERIENIKYFGIIIDGKRLKDHCDYMLKKIGEK